MKVYRPTQAVQVLMYIDGVWYWAHDKHGRQRQGRDPYETPAGIAGALWMPEPSVRRVLSRLVRSRMVARIGSLYRIEAFGIMHLCAAFE